MTLFLIDMAERAAIAAGQPAVVVAAAMPELEALPLTQLVPVQGVLRRAGAMPGPSEPLPDGLRPLALLAPDAAVADRLAAGLPPDLPRILGADPLPSLLDLSLRALMAAEAARAALLGSPGSRPPAARRMVIDLPPAPGGAAPSNQVSQSLGRPAEGLCAVMLHIAAARTGAASLLRVRLLAGGRVIGAWTLPGPDLAPGWLRLDLPMPAPRGMAEAVLRVSAEIAPEDLLQLSTTGTGPEAPLAIRAEVAEPHHLALPRHFDWAATGTSVPPAGLPLPVPEQVWQAAQVTGAKSIQVAAGQETARLMLEIPPGTTAQLALPALPPGATDLAITELSCRLGEAAGLQVLLQAGAEEKAPRESGWRLPDATGALRITMPLPAGLGGAVRLGLSLRNRGTAPLTVEVMLLALMAGGAGAPRHLPRQRDLPNASPAPQPARLAVPLPVPLAAPQAVAPPPPASVEPVAKAPSPEASLLSTLLAGPATRAAPVPPPLTEEEASAPPAPPTPTPAPAPMTQPAPAQTYAGDLAPGGADFQDVKLHQYNRNADGSYQHVDLGLSGLATASGVWREARLKLFDRRGTIGLEFRRIKGWPPMFEAWPEGGSDQYGPYWRVETLLAGDAMAKLASARDRAMIAAVLELLPTLVRRGALLAKLSTEEQEAWAERGQKLASAVETAREEPARPTVGPG